MNASQTLFFVPFLFVSLLQAAEERFVPLFNGRDLSNWTNVNCAPETFTVRDGIIVSTGIPTGVIRTKRMYENYIVELEWRHLKEGGNAGFFIHSAPVTAVGQPFTKGMEIQIIDRDHAEGIATRHGDVFAIHGATFVPDRPHPRGWMRSLPVERRVKPQGEWNHYRVESRDGVVTLAVNGKVVSGGSNCIPRKGYICLEAEGSECHFRNIRIMELPSTQPGPNEVAEEDKGFRSLYNGLDFRGWKPGKGSDWSWKAKDWILDSGGASQSGQELWTLESFRDFELIVDWRFPSKAQGAADSGIYLRGSVEAAAKINQSLGDSGARPDGQWNRFIITMRGGRMTVLLNDKKLTEDVEASGFPAVGPIGLRHRGSPIQFANIYVRELK